ncbi:MAG: hypothetical protein JW864_15130 [Spirochaetes bacterium]|nr:hypothetical protein [Spirochaetota bacterium]
MKILKLIIISILFISCTSNQIKQEMNKDVGFLVLDFSEKYLPESYTSDAKDNPLNITWGYQLRINSKFPIRSRTKILPNEIIKIPLNVGENSIFYRLGNNSKLFKSWVSDSWREIKVNIKKDNETHLIISYDKVSRRTSFKYNFDTKKNNDITDKEGNNGFLILDFSSDNLSEAIKANNKNGVWFTRIWLNGKLYFYEHIMPNEIIIRPVPTGFTEVEYTISNSNVFYEGKVYKFTSGQKKNIQFTISKNKFTIFRIKEVGEMDSSCISIFPAWSLLFLPWPGYSQSVYFDIGQSFIKD